MQRYDYTSPLNKCFCIFRETKEIYILIFLQGLFECTYFGYLKEKEFRSLSSKMKILLFRT